MALQTFTAGQVLTAAQVTALQTNGFNQSVSTKTADHTLVAADKGTRVEMNSASATTITVDTDLFNAGDTLFIQNIGAGVCTITAGTATVSTSGSLALAEFQGGTLYFVSAGVAIFFLTGSAGGVATLKDADISGTTGSPTTATYTDTLNFKTFAFTGSGSITTTADGLMDVMVVSGGGGNFGRGGAGGSAVITQTCFVLAGTYTVTVGAGASTTNSNTGGTKTGFPSSFGVASNTAIIIGIGGGNGASGGQNNGFSGASGGGSRDFGSSAGQALISGLGNNGGSSSTATGGGGGGAAAAGTNGASNVGGNGGNGVFNIFRTGASEGFGGGGAGQGSSNGTAGTGGGGAAATAGAVNTGGGSGGDTNNGKPGGSGIVIVRVLA